MMKTILILLVIFLLACWAPEVQAALSGGRDERWERMWKEFKNTMVAFKSHGTVTYEAVLETMNEMESMSAKEGE